MYTLRSPLHSLCTGLYGFCKQHVCATCNVQRATYLCNVFVQRVCATCNVVGLDCLYVFCPRYSTLFSLKLTHIEAIRKFNHFSQLSKIALLKYLGSLNSWQVEIVR